MVEVKKRKLIDLARSPEAASPSRPPLRVGDNNTARVEGDASNSDTDAGRALLSVVNM